MYRRIVEKTPDYFDALHFYGLFKYQQGHMDDAVRLVTKATKINPRSVNALNSLGVILGAAGHHADALASFDAALALEPNHLPALGNRGNSLNELRRYQDAIKSTDRALAINPNYLEAYIPRGAALLTGKRYAEALESYERAIRLNPNLAIAWLGRGNVLVELKRYDEALATYDKALALKPDLAEAWLGRGNAFFKLKRYDQAFGAYDKALTFNPRFAQARLGRGNVLVDLKRYGEALSAYDQAVALKSDLAEAWLGRGNALLKLKRHDEAFAACDKALAIAPDVAEAWLARGNVFAEIRRNDEAWASYQKALARKPDLAEAWVGGGRVLAALHRHDEAIGAYDKAHALDPGLAEAWLGRGSVFLELKRYDEAIAAYDKAIACKPDLDYVAGARLHAKQLICDWTNFDAEWQRLLSAVRSGAAAVEPFALIAGPSSLADHLKSAQIYIADQFPRSVARIWQGERFSHQRIRVAYLSADFREHPVAHLIASLIERHDCTRFEVIAIALGADDQSDMRARLKRAFDRFVDVDGKSDRDVALLIRELEVDIVVDLMGFTAGCRPAILAFRSAPVQVNYLSYPGIVGTGHIDYILADRFVIPEDHRALFHEPVVYLPDTYLGYDAKQRMSERIPTRAELGLPETGFVFCAYNNNFKILPQAFDAWMRLLRQVPGSVLWLSGANATAVNNLRREATARGVDPDRLCFAPFVREISDHLARYRLVDLFLDTLPFNAHTTACDALWAGVPVLTCLGPTFVGRVAASLLSAVGLPELITNSMAEYEALALHLATDAALLAGIKAKLERHRDTHPLFDSGRFTRHVEHAFTQMWQRSQRGEPPASFAVEPVD